LGINSLCKKFKQHFSSGGLFYAFWRGMKYIIFISRKKEQPRQNCFIESGALRILLSDCGIQIFWSGKQLTLSSGLNFGVHTLGLWTDSSKAKWELLQKERDFLKIRVSFDNLPLIQYGK
jgi:hypothetical protein